MMDAGLVPITPINPEVQTLLPRCSDAPLRRYASRMKKLLVLLGVAAAAAVAYRVLTAEIPIDES